MKNQDTFASQLKQFRANAGLSQIEVAKKLGYTSPQFISNWERGLANPPAFVCRELSKIYKVSADKMFDLVFEKVKSDLQREFSASRGKKKN